MCECHRSILLISRLLIHSEDATAMTEGYTDAVMSRLPNLVSALAYTYGPLFSTPALRPWLLYFGANAGE